MRPMLDFIPLFVFCACASAEPPAASYAPVCGCDDKTYGNACEAASAGVSARLKSKCPG